MTTNLPYSLETALQDEAHDPARLQAAFFRNIAKRLEATLLADSKQKLIDFHTKFAEIASLYFQGATRATQDAALGMNEAPLEVQQAFNLGQVNFAQLLISTATNRRADDQFMEVLRQPQTIKYLRPLLESDLSSHELAKESGTTPENISRKFKEFRELGIADFRKSGRNVINFLTPTAKDALREVLQSQFVLSDNAASNDSVFSSRTVILETLNNRRIPKHMQSSMSFSIPSMQLDTSHAEG